MALTIKTQGENLTMHQGSNFEKVFTAKNANNSNVTISSGTCASKMKKNHTIADRRTTTAITFEPASISSTERMHCLNCSQLSLASRSALTETTIWDKMMIYGEHCSKLLSHCPISTVTIVHHCHATKLNRASYTSRAEAWRVNIGIDLVYPCGITNGAVHAAVLRHPENIARRDGFTTRPDRRPTNYSEG